MNNVNPSNFADQKNNPSAVSAASNAGACSYSCEPIMSHKSEAMQPTQSIDQSPQPIAPASVLTKEHHQHLLDEGFTEPQIEQMIEMGARSIDLVTASSKGFRLKDASGTYRSSSGLYFPFTKTFGQIRADVPLTNAQGKAAKYLTPIGAKSEAMLPDGCKVITEGWKDAIAGSLHGGIPTGALAGVSHYRKALAPGSGFTVLFDADGWTNPGVFTNLFNAGVYLKGKIQLVPEIEGQPKAGLCEYFKAGHTAEDYQLLIESAMKPNAFLMALPDHWKGLEPLRLSKCIEALFKLAVEHLPDLVLSQLLEKVRGVTGIGKRDLAAELRKASRAKARRELREQVERMRAEQQKQQQSQPDVKGLIPFQVNERTGQPILPKTSAVAAILTEAYRDRLAFNVENEEFYRYSAQLEGIWSTEPLPFIQAAIQAELDSSGYAAEYSSDYIGSIIGLMKGRLAVRHWDEARGLLPMQNGILDLKSLKLLPFSPGYRLTWQLPYSYNPIATCEPIQQWMKQAQDGDEQRVQLLRAFLKAIVCGRTDLQRFLECLGPGGTGKSTYTRLAMALVGLQNTFVTELKQLESNRFETAGIRGKRLVVINDSERYGGNVTVLKSITGQDMIRDEQKFKQQGAGFVADAMVLIAANEAIQSSDYTSGLERRRLTVPFLNEVAPEQRRDLLSITHLGTSGEFVSYLPGLLNWVLEMPDDEMRSLILHTQTSVPSLARWKAESLLESNPIAEWLDGHLVLDSTAKTYVGVARKVRVTEGEPGNTTSREYQENADVWLYPSYVQNCHDLGNRPISVKRFVNLLEDLLRSQLRFKAFRGRDSSGSYFEGIAIRSKEHQGIKRPVSGEFDRDPRLVTVSVMDGDGTVTAETLTDVGFDGCDGFLETVATGKIIFSALPPDAPPAKNNLIAPDIKEENPSHPSNPTQERVSAITPPIIKTKEPSPDPSPIAVRDRVLYVGNDPGLRNVCGKKVLEVTAVRDGVVYLLYSSWYVPNQCPIADVQRVQA